MEVEYSKYITIFMLKLDTWLQFEILIETAQMSKYFDRLLHGRILEKVGMVTFLWIYFLTKCPKYMILVYVR
jgi:hypothetical protein